MITTFSNCLCYNNVKRYGFIMNVIRKKKRLIQDVSTSCDFVLKKYDNEINKNRCKYKYNKCNVKIFQAQSSVF